MKSTKTSLLCFALPIEEIRGQSDKDNNINSNNKIRTTRIGTTLRTTITTTRRKICLTTKRQQQLKLQQQ